jgi:type II secretory pathway pseudopilin PulG
MSGKRGRSGFTLLEAAVAMSIIALVGIGALAAFGADLRAAGHAQQALPGASLARERMAVLELAEPQTLRMLPDSLTHGTFGAPFSAYAWTATAGAHAKRALQLWKEPLRDSKLPAVVAAPMPAIQSVVQHPQRTAV